MSTKYIYYGWVDHKDCKYGVYSYPIIEEKVMPFNIHCYVVDNYLVTSQQQSTRYIEDQYLDRELNIRKKVTGMMTLDHNKALKWVKEKKLKRESYLLGELEKIQTAKIDNCGEAIYI